MSEGKDYLQRAVSWSNLIYTAIIGIAMFAGVYVQARVDIAGMQKDGEKQQGQIKELKATVKDQDKKLDLILERLGDIKAELAKKEDRR